MHFMSGNAKSSLKSYKFQNLPPIQEIFTPAAIRNGFLIKFYKKNVKNFQIDPLTTEICPKQPLSVSDKNLRVNLSFKRIL